MDYGVGDYVSLLMKDGAEFKGVIMFIHEDYLILTPCLGYAMADIVRIERAY